MILFDSMGSGSMMETIHQNWVATAIAIATATAIAIAIATAIAIAIAIATAMRCPKNG